MCVCSLMLSHPAGTNATKLCMASSFIQKKVEGYVWIKKIWPQIKPDIWPSGLDWALCLYTALVSPSREWSSNLYWEDCMLRSSWFVVNSTNLTRTALDRAHLSTKVHLNPIFLIFLSISAGCPYLYTLLTSKPGGGDCFVTGNPAMKQVNRVLYGSCSKSDLIWPDLTIAWPLPFNIPTPA